MAEVEDLKQILKAGLTQKETLARILELKKASQPTFSDAVFDARIEYILKSSKSNNTKIAELMKLAIEPFNP